MCNSALRNILTKLVHSPVFIHSKFPNLPTSRSMADSQFRTSTHAQLYAQFRPSPPPELINQIVERCTQKRKLLDVGCGSGQSTVPLAVHFGKVVGVDVSREQVLQAEKKRKEAGLENIEFLIGSSDALPAEDNSLDALTGSQCVHWFDLDKFYAEAYRVLESGGILAMFGYCVPVPKIQNESADSKGFDRIMSFYREEMGPCWDVDRTLLDNCYRTLPEPKQGFKLELRNESIKTLKGSSLRTYMSYLSSWSPYQKYHQKYPDDDILGRLEKDLQAIYGTAGDAPLNVETNFFLLMYRKM